VTELDHSVSWPYDAGEPGPFSYARVSHPPGEACEAALGELDGGHALLFPSGMAAVTTAVLTLARPGRTIALAEGAYYGHRTLLDLLESWGLRCLEYDQRGRPPADADLILVEAPANPMLTMPDFAAVAEHPAPVVCDATVASPLRVRALDEGCEVALHSATKILGGHDDVLAGVLVTRDDDLHERLRTTRHRTGMVASADTAWRVHRRLETLAERVGRQEATARALVDRLRLHPAVTAVRYPGFSFLVSFDVAGGEEAHHVERSLQLIVNATSLGGTKTKVEARHRWEGARCPPGLLRLSVGLEDPQELWADLEQALDRLGSRP
jgi:cystathionine gamma-synthase